MWFLVRLMIAGGAFCLRFFGWIVDRTPKGNPVHVDNIPCYVHERKSKNSIMSTWFSVKLPGKHLFTFHRESTIDSFFKNIGLATELQTGDQTFDRFVYVVSDSQSFNQKVSLDGKLRSLIVQLLKFDGCEFIRGNGHLLQVKLSGQSLQHRGVSKVLVEIRNTLQSLEVQSRSFFDDPFVWKTLFVEGVIWSFAGYSIGAVLDFWAHDGDLYLFPGKLIGQGLLLGAVTAAILVFVTFLLMRGSSRGHKIILESGVVLSLSLPILGVQSLSDVNIELDQPAPTIVEMLVTDKDVRRIRRKRAPPKMVYTLILKSPNSLPMGISLPDRVKVESEVFSRAKKGGIVRIVLGNGFLGHFYYRAFEFP